MMETGTGKTYTYTKTIFELNKLYGIFKFVIVVPTLSIKAGTIDFLKSESSREHFKEQYDKTINLHIVESKNSSKKKNFPPAISNFVNAEKYEKNSIQVMIINAGMVNSDTMANSFHKSLFDKYSVPFEAIRYTNSFMIIDEPHKFAKHNKTWENIQKMKPQFILRFGATFPDKEIDEIDIFNRNKKIKVKVKEYHNLVYQLTAVDSFNKNLVKGVIGYITEFSAGGGNAVVEFIDSDGKEASFKLTENNKKETLKLTKGQSLSLIHNTMQDLAIENLNKNSVILSNGLEMKKGDKINPYSYAQTLQETMIQKAIKNHFEIEKQLLKREVKIKPLSLFFIDNIDEYRDKAGYIRKTVELYTKAEIEKLLETETDEFFTAYLNKALKDISLTHAGYFSKDNSEKDEAIEKEINEILHDKQAMLDLNNPRRFIFSKWTLREGWDNPNVFQICKLRSSGSEISKLQEVGRGLRLPVNEFGNRVKDEQFYLNYFVDFTETDFVEKLVNEINLKSGTIPLGVVHEKLTENMIKKICKYYDADEDDLIDDLVEKKVIRASHKFLEGGYDYMKNNYPRIFDGVDTNKVRLVTDLKHKISVRTEKYPELMNLWEKLNEKVILEYKFDDERHFKEFFVEFLKTQVNNLTADGLIERISTVTIKDNSAIINETESIYKDSDNSIKTLKYSDFLKQLAKILSINLHTVHRSIIESKININKYLNHATLRILKHNFDYFLMAKALDKFSIEYKKVSNSIHPTKFTDENGSVLDEVISSDIGLICSKDSVAENYFFNDLYYDSELERQNIVTNIQEVIVFTKIPKNSIKIPVAGGKHYSPDFAYVLKFKDGKQKLNFIVETKNVNSEAGLRDEEKFKIKHAELFFGNQIEIKFSAQFSNDKMFSLIQDVFAPCY